MPNNYPMVRVRWQDITAYDNWRSVDDDSPILEVDTLGYLLENEPGRISVASSVSYEDKNPTPTTGNRVVFPPSVVKSITRLDDGRKIRKA